MAVARLGSASTSDATNALAHTVPAGTNRCLMVTVTQEVASPSQLAVGYGGQSMSAVVGIAVGDSTDQRVDIYYLNDAGIAAASDNQIDVTSPPATFSITAQAYEGAVQTTPTTVDSEAITGDSDPLTNIQISAVADEAVFGVGGSGNTSTGVTWAGTNPLIALANTNANSTAHVAIADRLVTGTETVNHNLTFTTAPNRVAGAACLIEATAPAVANITGVVPSEFDFDNTDVDIDGVVFEASQGTGQVWISDASTLAGSANEVEIDGAINTWGDTQVNLDFSGLSQSEIDDLHTLGPGSSRWIILENDSGDETSFQITLHRPQAFQMVLGNIVPGTTTARLTGMTGSFGGGRAEETAAQNPSTTDTDVADDGNREDLWSIEAKPNSVDGDTYDFRVLYDDAVADTITQTPQVTIQDVNAATGAPEIILLTSAGAAEIIKPATGAPSIILPTSSGAAEIIKPATGSPSIILPTSSGAAEIIKTADGAPSIILPTASGTAEILNTATGAPSIILPTSAGTAGIDRSATGAPSIILPTSSGAAEITKPATGAPSIILPTSAGAAEIIKPADGSPSIILPTSSGAAEITKPATGAPAIILPTSAGTAEIIKTATGSPEIILPTSAGTADADAGVGADETADGAPEIILPTSTGAAEIIKPATGAPEILLPTSAGAAEITKPATGAPSIILPTSSGVAEIVKTATGAPSIILPTSAGESHRCSEILPPDTIAAIVALSGDVTDIDEPVNSPDGNWLLLAA